MSLWWPEIGEKLGYMAAGVMPHLGYKEDADLLWDGLRTTGDITCIGTDGMVPPREKRPRWAAEPLVAPLPPSKERPGYGFPQHDCMFPGGSAHGPRKRPLAYRDRRGLLL